MSIQVKQLLKIYGEQKAVNGVSFNVDKGQVLGFLGPNGAGKSTTMKILTGYLTADDGTVTICGINVADDPKAAKKKIGYLPESNALYPDMYVKEYLDFVAGIYKVDNKKTQVKAVIDKVGLAPESGKKIGQLSKGYKQRVGLAAALIHDPEVLILDEPTSGLDPNQIVDIREVIKTLGRDKTVLFSTHIMQEVEAICDRVVIINKGNIVANDKLSNLKKAGAQNLKVQFKEALEAAWLERLSAVSEANKLDSFNWEISSTDLAAARRQIMQMAIDHHLNIVAIREGGSLEEVFRNLTSK